MEKSKRRKKARLHSEEKAGPRRRSVWVLLVGGIALLGAAIALVLVVISGNQQSTAGSAVYAGIPPEWQNRNVLGNPEAPVTVEAWEDFRCPACAAFNQMVKPALVENYIASGEAKLEFRHFPLQQHEPGASLAAQASECAADQGHFWGYHDRVFEVTQSGPSAFIAERLIEYAVDLELEEESFSSCLLDQTHLGEVNASLQAARAAGLSGTPTVLVDGIPVTNPLDYDSVAAAIDGRLAVGQ
ncbi:MAG: thioredoxin domain-containing protein [Caldilineaceae bacterium]|nr:thioredoxin domain-containing protein [Caldilineaceae bacterium]